MKIQKIQVWIVMLSFFLTQIDFAQAHTKSCTLALSNAEVAQTHDFETQQTVEGVRDAVEQLAERLNPEDPAAALRQISEKFPTVSKLLDRYNQGFTLIELMTVVSIIAVLTALLIPTLSKVKEKAHRVACLNNQKQLSLCWVLYAGDNDDQLVPNNSFRQLNNTDAASSFSWAPDHPRTDTDTTNLKSGLLFSYNQTVQIYHCPSDQAKVEGPAGEVGRILRDRSYTLSQSNNGNPDFNPITKLLPADRKLSQINKPTQRFVFTDEHADSMLDGQFGNPVNVPGLRQDVWWDVPASYHGRGSNFSFADGHIEHWQWTTPKIVPKNTIIRPVSPAEIPDYRRLQSAMKLFDEK